MATYTILAVKAHTVSDDGADVKVTLATKHVGDMTLSMPADCLSELISALSQAKAAIPSKQLKTATPAKQTIPAAPSPQTKTAIASKGGKDLNQVTITVPKKFMVGADLRVHDVVLLIFDQQTESQTGYALNADAAKQMAVGLVKNADAVLTKKAGKEKGNQN
jgi:hypothetical protein